MEKKNYQTLEHPADLKIQARGKSLKEVFSNILKAMFEACQPEIDSQSPLINRQIQIKADNIESSLIDFLSEIIYLSDVNNEAYFKVNFETLTDKELRAEIKGQKVKSFQTEIKAATWHDLEIKKENNQWQAIILFDI